MWLIGKQTVEEIDTRKIIQDGTVLSIYQNRY